MTITDVYLEVWATFADWTDDGRADACGIPFLERVYDELRWSGFINRDGSWTQKARL